MYLALFLAPWMSMYAISTLAMNHRDFFVAWYGDSGSSWQIEREIDVPASFPEGADSERVAQRILADLELDGRHDVRGKRDGGAIMILRHDPFAPRRIKYLPDEGTLSVERGSVRIHGLLNQIHGRRGYQHGYAAEVGWAASVDLVIIAMVFWALSGLWLWWNIPRTRLVGCSCLVVGVGLFALFVFTI